MGKILIIAGIIMVIAGIVLQYAHKLPLPGKLPGDMVIDRGNFKLFIPVTTSILISLLISIVLFLINRAKH